jgi:hypothetical protein
MTFIGDANDTATILADANIFFSSYFAASDDDEAKDIKLNFNGSTFPGYWGIGQKTSALIQMYDLVAPLDAKIADRFLGRLGSIAVELLADRDDNRGFPADPFRGRVMPAWGAFTDNRDGKWNTDVVTSALFTYAMAAFARRVADHPVRYAQHQAKAIALITATIETYEAFRPELHLVEGDPHAFFFLPLSYRSLKCDNGASGCDNYRAGAGQPIAYNESLSMMKALAEVALAADSAMYRGSADARPDRLKLATEEAPLVVAKNVAYRAANLRPKTLADGTPYSEWDYQTPGVRRGRCSRPVRAWLPDRRPRCSGPAQRSSRACGSARASPGQPVNVRSLR